MLAPAFVNGLGIVAAALSALTFVPQLLEVWRTRTAHDVSGFMLGIAGAGMVLWLVYGVAERSLPIVLGNAVNLLFTLLLAYSKRHFRPRPPAGLPPLPAV